MLMTGEGDGWDGGHLKKTKGCSKGGEVKIATAGMLSRRPNKDVGRRERV